MRAVDTNVLVRLLARDHATQLGAAEEFVAPGAWVSLLVLMEAVWVLETVYEVKPNAIAAGIELLLQHKRLSVEDGDVVERAVVSYRRRPSVGFSDCLILEVARRAGHLPLGTFDRNLSKLEGTQRLT